jgi:hypothetical protein
LVNGIRAPFPRRGYSPRNVVYDDGMGMVKGQFKRMEEISDREETV